VIGCLVTTFNRPSALERSLPQIIALGAPVLVVDDGSNTNESEENRFICSVNGALYVRLPGNRGLAAAWNIGLDYWLADKGIHAISYFQDDTDISPKCLEIMEHINNGNLLLTGHDAGEHPAFKDEVIHGVSTKLKWGCRATHMHASVEFWKSVYPIPTRELGAPKRTGEGCRGLGSNADWWIVRDSPNSCQKTQRPIICVPGLVRTFLWEAKDSCWNNTQKAGEDGPLAA
jgi:glycosyltransferase involved in cell wall biosynthesis